MSSYEEELLGNTESQKNRRRAQVQRACDHCRKKRKKCEKPAYPQSKCSNCAELDIECTFKEAPKKRGLPRGYVEVLEHRIRVLEKLVVKLCPDKTTLHGLIYDIDPEYAAHFLSENQISDLVSTFPINSNVSPFTSSAPTEPTTINDVLDITHKVLALSLGSKEDPFIDYEGDEQTTTESDVPSSQSEGFSGRFWGKSSKMMFMHTALLIKNNHTQRDPADQRILKNRRPYFWKRLPWDTDFPRPSVNYLFPPPDLIVTLSNAYFDHINLVYPLLHRPTFERGISNDLHLQDEGYGSVVLLVCAIGARFTDSIDTRTLIDGETSPYSAGWKWYKQVQVVKSGIVTPPTLYDLQIYCLAVYFLTGFNSPESMWLLAGFGIRLAQDVGAHRRRVPRDKLTIEDELWKRAFWSLVYIDRMTGASTGRPCAIIDENLDMPIECDDEFWENSDPRYRFKQPEGKPSTVTAFVQTLRLTKIMSFATSTLYSIKAKWWETMLSSKWEQHIVSELDSALNNWISELPDCLLWDPNRTDERFYRLSGNLMTLYHYVQILIHRPFIRLNGTPSPLAFPSLAICTSAARSCSRILEQHMNRSSIVYANMQITCVSAAIVLLVSIWGGRRSGAMPDPTTMRQVETCKELLRKAEERFHYTGAMLDVLNELTSAGEMIRPEECTGLNSLSPTSEAARNRSLSSWPQHSSSSSDQKSNVDDEMLAESQSYSHNIGIGVPHYMPPELHPGQNSFYGIGSVNTSNVDYSNVDELAYGNPTRDYFSSFDSNASSYDADEHFNSNENFVPHNVYPSQQENIDNNTMAMWVNAPNGFQLNEWNSFLANFMEVTNTINSDPSQYSDAPSGPQEPSRFY